MKSAQVDAEQTASPGGNSLSAYVALVKGSIEFSKNIRDARNEIEILTNNLESEISVIREELSVIDDVIFGLIPVSALKKRPRPPYMLLTPEERLLADQLLDDSNSGSSAVIASRNNIEVTGDKLQCLNNREWLNDEVINFYFDMLNELGKENRYYKTYLWNSFFWLKLCGDGKGYNYKAVQRWTSRKKIDIFEYDRIIVPMNIGKNHWALGLVDLKDKAVKYYDSLAANTIHKSFSEFILQYLEDEFKDKKRNDECPDFKSFEVLLVEPPQQRNGFDCGVFTCMNAECLVSGRDWIDFDQSMIPDMRRKIAVQIHNHRIK